MTKRMPSSYKRRARATKAITIRVPEARLRKVMRARKALNQSELINALLTEEEERLEAERVLRETLGSADAADLDDRFL
jgi:hypothetical protein